MHRVALPPRFAAASLTLALLASLAPQATAQVVDLPFPLELETGLDLGNGSLHFNTPAAGNEYLEAFAEVRFVGVPLPDGTEVDLLMSQAPTSRLKFGMQVDGVPAPKLEQSLGLTVWIGEIEGHPNSSAALAFSKYGSRGWIQRGPQLFHLLAGPDPQFGWKKSFSNMMEESTLIALGNTPQPNCVIDSLPSSLGGPVLPTGVQPQLTGGTQNLSQELIEIPTAVETDTQLFDVFGDVAAEATYVTTLLTWVSFRYEEQIAAVMTFPYLQFYTQGTDPWLSQDSGGNSVALLYEFQAAWLGNQPQGTKLATFLSGANLGGGVAWLGGLCTKPYNFNVCGNIGGSVQFPVVQQGGNWDFVVTAHEMGHNLNAQHTHELNPPLDECAPPGYFGYWQTQQVCSSSGTVMSYCHLCSGGTANITTYFHDVTAGVMRSWIEGACLPLYVRNAEIYCTAKPNSQGCTPQIDANGHATLAGLDNFHITASNVLNNKSGILFFGSGKAALPFAGGTKCVAPPTRRTVVQNSGGTVGPDDCTGTLDLYLSHAWFQGQNLPSGTILYAQYWTHDPLSQWQAGLTDAIKFEVAP